MNDATHRRKRLVVKIGSATLTTSESSIDYGFLNDLADQVARVRAARVGRGHRHVGGYRLWLGGAGHRQATGATCRACRRRPPWGRAPFPRPTPRPSGRATC